MVLDPRFLKKQILLLEVFQQSVNDPTLPIYKKTRPGLGGKQQPCSLPTTSSLWQTLSGLFVRTQRSAFLANRVGLECVLERVAYHPPYWKLKVFLLTECQINEILLSREHILTKIPCTFIDREPSALDSCSSKTACFSYQRPINL